MIFLPIVDRELRVAARRPATYRTRVWAASGAIALAAWKSLSLGWQGASSASRGQSLFYTLAGLAFIYCLAIGARVTSDCVSEEKREGTLGLLFLTDLKGLDVVLGKLAASSVNSLYGLLAVLPLLAMPILLGGVTLAQFGRTALVLLNALFFSLSVGMCISALSRNDRKAAFGTLLFVFGLSLLPFAMVFFLLAMMEGGNEVEEIILLLPFLALSPVYPFAMSLPLPALPFPIPPSSFWMSLAVIHLLGWGALLLTARILPLVWRDRATAPTPRPHLGLVEQWRVWAYGNVEQRRTLRARLLERNPFLWLVSRDRLKPSYAWFFLGSMVLVWLWGYFRYGDVMFDFYPLAPTVMLVHCFLKVWVVSEVSHRLVEDQRNGALELLLSTPLTIEGIMKGQQMAALRQFAGPVLVLCAIELAVFRTAFPVIWILPVLIMLATDLLTLLWVSLRLSLRARSINEVLAKSLGWVLVAPWVLYLALWPLWKSVWYPQSGLDQPLDFGYRLYLWFLIGLLTDWFWLVIWARPWWLGRAEWRGANLRPFVGAQGERKWRAWGFNTE